MIWCRLKHLRARCKQRGRSLEDVGGCIVEQRGDRILVDESHPSYPAKDPPAGPGSQLRSLLADWLGVESSPGCACQKTADKMDAMGAGWCKSEAGMAEIIGVMRTEHAKRKSARTIVLPWSEFAARRLVLLACRRAESLKVY